jgi:hypothetical protein
MTLLAIDLHSLNSRECLPLLNSVLKGTHSGSLTVVIFLRDRIRGQLDTPAKRVARYKSLQRFLAEVYVCSATGNTRVDVVFKDWCGYELTEEEWDYETVYVPECTRSGGRGGGSDGSDV